MSSVAVAAAVCKRCEERERRERVREAGFPNLEEVEKGAGINIDACKEHSGMSACPICMLQDIYIADFAVAFCGRSISRWMEERERGKVTRPGAPCKGRTFNSLLTAPDQQPRDTHPTGIA